ncbi:hypothetical protein GC207_14595 [bacterium]|nr:hypothetical protein [bacterium]
MKQLISGIITLSAVAQLGLAAEPLYHNDFESSPIGSQPDGFLVIDGQFAVQEFEGNKVFELPGAPLETFGFIFGPNFRYNDAGDHMQFAEKDGPAKLLDGVAVTARAYGLKKGRRYPTFAIGLCGVGGFKLRVAPMKGAVELVSGDTTIASVDYRFASGTWIRLKLEVRYADGKWITEGKVWKDGETEPADWLLKHASAEKPNPGKASAWAAPFSGQPIRFDDLQIDAVAK